MRVRYGMSRRWAKHVAGLKEGRKVYSVLVGKFEEKYLGADGRTILKWIFKKRVGRRGLN